MRWTSDSHLSCFFQGSGSRRPPEPEWRNQEPTPVSQTHKQLWALHREEQFGVPCGYFLFTTSIQTTQLTCGHRDHDMTFLRETSAQTLLTEATWMIPEMFRSQRCSKRAIRPRAGRLYMVSSGASSWQRFSLRVQCLCDRVTSSRVFECGGTVELTVSTMR